MYDNIDQLVNANLKLLFESKKQYVFISDFVDENGKRLSYMNGLGEAKKLAEYMLSKGLIDITKERCDLTQLGHEVCKYGGWVEVSKHRAAKEEYEEREKRKRDDLELSKLRYDYKLARWQVHVFWPVFILGIFGGAYSTYDVIKKISGPNEFKEQTINKVQLDSAINNLKITLLDSLKTKQKTKIVNDSSALLTGD